MQHRPPVATLFLDPLSYHLERDRLFESGSTPYSGDRILEPYVHLRERLAMRGVATHTGDRIGAVPRSPVSLYATLGLRTRWKRLASRDDVILSAFFLNECPVAEPAIFADLPELAPSFGRLYSFAGDDAMAEFTSRRLSYRPYRYPYAFEDVDVRAWKRAGRAFMAMINANKLPRLRTRELYTERMRAVAYFEARQEIDLYGIGWDGPPYRIGETRMPRPVRRLAFLAERAWAAGRPGRDPLLAAARRAWRGAVVSKSETLSGYTFAICFENMALEGWVTEKVFDCLRAGTIPVYLGAPDVERWLDPDCFVDMRRFAGYDDLRAYLLALGPREVAGYREAGREYFRSDRFKPFTKEAFADLVERVVVEDAGLDW